MWTFDAPWPIRPRSSPSIVIRWMRTDNLHFVVKHHKWYRWQLTNVNCKHSPAIQCLFLDEKSDHAKMQSSDILTYKKCSYKKYFYTAFVLNKKDFVSVEPDSRVIRECGSNVTEIKTDCYQRHGFHLKKEICECDISYCNGTNGLRVSSVATIFGVALSLAMMKYVLSKI